LVVRRTTHNTLGINGRMQRWLSGAKNSLGNCFRTPSKEFG
jgi:hypothetical protein